MSQTYTVTARAAREYSKLSRSDRRRFTIAHKAFVEALRSRCNAARFAQPVDDDGEPT